MKHILIVWLYIIYYCFCNDVGPLRQLKKKKWNYDDALPLVKLIEEGPGPIMSDPPVPVTINTITTEVLYSCPNGFTKLSQTDCEKIITIPATMGCEEGSELINSICVGISQIRPDFICPDSFDSYANGECRATIYSKPTLACPTNYSFDGKLCFRRIVQDAYSSCPKDFALKGTYCVQTIEAKPKLICPVDYELEKESCYRDIPVSMVDMKSLTPECSKKFGESQALFDSIANESNKFECPIGYQAKKGKCSKHILVNSILDCTQNEPIGDPEESNFKKKKERRQKASVCNVVCPKDSESIGTKCSTEVFADPVTPIQPIAVEISQCAMCPKGSTYNPKLQLCTSRNYVQPNYECSSQFQLVEDMSKKTNSYLCIGEVVAPTEPICPQGSIFDGVNKCILDVSSEPAVVCHDLDATLDDKNENCVKTIFEKPILFCPKDYTPYLSDQICMKQSKSLPGWLCPIDAKLQLMDNNKKPKSDESMTPLNSDNMAAVCLQIESKPTHPSCPKGFELQIITQPIITTKKEVDKDPKHNEEYQCVKVELNPILEQPSPTYQAPAPVFGDPQRQVVYQYIMPSIPDPILAYHPIEVEDMPEMPKHHKKKPCHHHDCNDSPTYSLIGTSPVKGY